MSLKLLKSYLKPFRLGSFNYIKKMLERNLVRDVTVCSTLARQSRLRNINRILHMAHYVQTIAD